MLLKHVRQQPPSARSFVSSISDAVDSVLQKALQKRSEDRYLSATEFLQAFAHAVKIAPIASPASRAIPTVKLQPLYTTSKTSPLTPPVETIESPQTPIPAEDALDTPNPAALPRTREFSSSHMPPLFVEYSPSMNISTSLSRAPEEAEVLAHHFLNEPDKQGDSLFWSVDPAEWSPIAKEMEEDTKAGVPLTANEYLQNKPLVLMTPNEAAQEQKVETFQARFKKVLPLLVVLLLLLGLLGAMLSAFFYPTSKSGAYIAYIGTYETKNYAIVSIYTWISMVSFKVC